MSSDRKRYLDAFRRRVANVGRPDPPAPATPTRWFVEVRCEQRFLTYAVATAAGVPLRLIDFAPPRAPGVEIALLYGPLPDTSDPHAEAAIVANLEDMGIDVLAHRPTLYTGR